ncbi:MAG: ParA family protein [Ornithinimicrobium sp.]
MADPQRTDPQALSRVVAVINGKGGVLKTSVVANVGGRAALEGMRVLLIDLDISGNLKLDLGMLSSEHDDAGKGLTEAVWYGQGRLPIVPNVRPGLDLVFGGRGLEILGQMARSALAEELPTGSIGAEFAARIAEVAHEYDLIVLDCPPGNTELQDMALAAARWVLIPTKTDEGSLGGLLGVGPRVKRARRSNPQLSYVGVVVTAHNPGATRLYRATAARLAEVGETVPMLRTVIRHSQSAADDCRVRGQLVHELARDVAGSKSHRLKALSARRRGGGGNVIALPTALSNSAGQLSDDYRALTREICDRITQAENEHSPATSDRGQA